MSRRAGLLMPTFPTAFPVAFLMAFLMAFLIAMAPAMAQQGLRFQTDPNAPLDMVADEMRWQQNEGLADLTGNVVVEQGPMRLSAGHMRVIFENGTATRLRAEKNVLLQNDDGQKARAEKADFDLQKDLMVLRGAVSFDRLTEKGTRQKLTGARLAVDMVSGKAQLTGGKNRARIELQND